MYQVKHDVALPTLTESARGRRPTYPLAQLGVGDSFAAPPTEHVKIGSAAKIWKRRHPGWDYKTLKSDHEFRLWRVA